MRRWKAKITAACGVLGLTLGLVMFLPRLLELNASRQVLQEQIETTLGGPVQWSRLELGIEPLRLGLVDAELRREAAFRVEEVVLFESRLRPSGAKYIPLERIPLGGTKSRRANELDGG